MKVLVLHGRSPSANGLELFEKAQELGHDVTLGSILDISSQVSNAGSRFWLKGVEISDTDVCFLRSFGPGSCEQTTRRISMIEHMEVAGIRVVNPGYQFRRARDKYATQYVLASAGLPVAETFTTESLNQAYGKAEELGVSVFKPILGSMGKGILKFDAPDLAFNAFKTLGRIGEPLIVQEYLRNPGRDMRIFVVGDRVVGTSFKYGAEGNWKTNVAQGGRMVDEPVPVEYKELGLKAVKAMRLDYAGVDIMETDRGPVILEVNGAPGWQALKESTGTDIAMEIVKYATSGIE